MSRFRPVYRELTDKEKALMLAIKEQAERLCNLFDQALQNPVQLDPSGVTSERIRYKSLAVTNLEQAVMWAIKAVTT